MRLVFDIEADGFEDNASQIWCIVAKDPDSGVRYTFGPNEVELGLKLLSEAEEVIGQNILRYDLRLLKRLYPWFSWNRVTDTLILSRLLFTNLSDTDKSRPLVCEAGQTGMHNLESWGLRFGVPKVVHEDWTRFTPEMLERCVVDVDITERLWKLCESKKPDPRSVLLEHRVAEIIAEQSKRGFPFDLSAARALTAELLAKLAVLETELQDTFKPFYLPKGPVKVPKKTMRRLGVEYTEGQAYQPIALTVFNPGSRHHIAHRLKALFGWVPKVFTENGQPKIDDDILAPLPWPEAQLLCTYFMVQKRLSLLQGAKKSKGWLELVKDGRLHGDMITNGAVTGRGTHKVIANVPRVSTPYGKELRGLFTASKGRRQVGVDMSGIELRLFAHYLSAYDGGAYGKVVCNGDVHTTNQLSAGLPTRDNAKTFIYGFLYGAGDEKIGKIVGSGKKRGGELRKKFLASTPGLEKLIKLVKEKAETRGYLIGLDGRKLYVRKAHAALNTLLQSAGAILSKQWMVECDDEIKRRGWEHDVQQLIWYHDELQFDVVPHLAEEWGKLSVVCLKRAAEYFGIHVPIDGEFKIGSNWKECH